MHYVFQNVNGRISYGVAVDSLHTLIKPESFNYTARGIPLTFIFFNKDSMRNLKKKVEPAVLWKERGGHSSVSQTQPNLTLSL